MKEYSKLISFKQHRTDTLFDSNQIICELTIRKDVLNQLDFTFLQESTALLPTSEFASNHEVIAAINGGFFDLDNGGSITYFELHDSVLAYTRDYDVFNGAIVLNDVGELVIERAMADSFYGESQVEQAVLVSGPLLLLDGVKSKLPDRKLVTDRHPRTCVCETNDAYLFVTIDGRSLEAAGMTLDEVQEYLLSVDCMNAINLDGGGSTTMWLVGKGIVNYPSDITGERPVANVLAITAQN